MDKTRLRIAFIGDSLTEGLVGASYFDILQDKLSQHELLNYGKGGDTMISLFRRLHEINFKPPLDIGFLWIGINDVFVKTNWSFPLVNAFEDSLGQKVIRNSGITTVLYWNYCRIISPIFSLFRLS